MAFSESTHNFVKLTVTGSSDYFISFSGRPL